MGRGDPAPGGADVRIVLGGINVGDQAQIATHSMLRDDLPAGMLAAGAPAIVKGKNPAAVNQE